MNDFLSGRASQLRWAMLLGLAAVGATGCQSVRVVSQGETGGVIAIPFNSDMWPFRYRSKAEAMLAQKCPEGYIIELEEEYVTGQTTNVQEDRREDAHQISRQTSFTVGSTNTTATTSDVKEWRIYYRKKGAEDEEGASGQRDQAEIDSEEPEQAAGES